MKADKANRESLAKKKSAVKADLERVTAELEEVEQMKADAEDLEDEELLAEMLSEEQRLQAVKQQYTAELASIQEASQAAAQALRQRLRRITGDRALGASGKSTSSESSQPATPVSAHPTSLSLGSAPFNSAPSTDSAPPEASYSSGALLTATSNVAEPLTHQSSYAGSSSMSNLPLSASWGAPSAPVQMSMPAQTSRQTHGESAQRSESQQEPQYRDFGSSQSFLPQQPISASPGTHSAAGDADRSQVSMGASAFADSADSTAYQPSASQKDHSQKSHPVVNSTNSIMPSMHTQGPNQAACGDTSRLDVTSPVAVEQEVEANTSRLNALDQVLPAESGQRLFKGQSELTSKPPRPAASFLGQQGGAKTGTYGLPISGGLQDRTSSKASMMSAGSGYQADSDSNSDVQLEHQRSSLESQTSPQLAQVSSTTSEHESAAAAPPPESATVATEAETDAEPEAKPVTHTSMLGKLGDTVWGAVEALTGHSTDSTAAEKGESEEAESRQLQTEALPKASQQAGHAKTGTTAGDGAAQQPQLTKADSGYEAGEEGPVQAGPEGTLQHSQGAEQSTMSMAIAPVDHSSGFTDRQTQPSSSWMGYNEPQLGSESADEPGAQHGVFSSSQQPLHVQTDAASSKRGISGVGDNQPGSASKRARGESAISKLIDTFDSPGAEPLSPRLGRRGSGTAATRTYFTSPHDQQGGFTLGTSPSQGRAATSSPFSATTTFRAPHSETLGSAWGSGILPEEDSYQQSTRASQGSIDTNRDNLGSAGSISAQSELNNELNLTSQTRGLSGALPESAANLAQTGVSLAGAPHGISHAVTDGSTAGVTGAVTEGVPVVSAPLTSAPPSANWGSASSYTPSITPTVSATQQEYGQSDSKPYHEVASLSQDLPAQHEVDSGYQSYVAQRESEPELSAQSVYTSQETPARQDSNLTSFEPSNAYSAQVTGPASEPLKHDTVPPTSSAKDTGHDIAAAAAPQFETPVPTTYSAQGLQYGEPAFETQHDQGLDSFAEPNPAQNSTTAHESVISPVAQDNQAGFGDDAFAQFSPFGHKAKQQTSPFRQQAEAQHGAQAGFDGQEVPLEVSAHRAPSGQTASGGLLLTEDAPQGIKEQVTPTSVTGTFAERSPFQSTWPAEVTQDLESQQSLGGSSFHGLTGKPSSPRRRPPPPPTGGSSFVRSTSGLPLSPTQANQGSLEGLPSDAFGELPNPSQSRPPIADPNSQSKATPSQQTDNFMDPPPASSEARSVPQASTRAVSQIPTGTGAASQQALSTAAASSQMPSNTGGVSGVPVSTARMSVMPTGAGVMIQGGDVVPMPPPLGPPTGQGQGTDSLFVGKTAFDGAVKAAPEPAAKPGIAQESAFSKANTAGTGPHFGSNSPKASTAPHSQPLASWTSFEDPGPLPPMPAPTLDDDPSDQDIFAPLPTATAAQPSTIAAAQPAKAAAAPSAESVPARQVSKQRSNDPWATPVEPPAEVKAAENELLSVTLAGLGGDAWGGNSFGPEMGKPLKEAGLPQDSATAAVKAPSEPAAAKSQAEPLTSQPSWMHLANSSNPFSSFIPMDSSAAEPNPWATTAPQAAPEQQTFPPQPMGQAMGSSAHQQQAPQQAAFPTWDSFDTAAPVAYPAIDDRRHPDVPSRSGPTQTGTTHAASSAMAPQQQQQYPSPPSGPGPPKAEPAFGQDWAAFGPSGQTAAQPTTDLWSAFGSSQQQQQQQQPPPRAAIVDSWASFDAPSEQSSALSAPPASQQARQGISNINSQDSWSALDPGNNAVARSRTGLPPPSSSSSASQQGQAGRQPQAAPPGNGFGGNSEAYGARQPISPDRKNSIEEIPVQELGLDPSLTIVAKPKEGMAPSQGQYDYPQQGAGQSQGYESQSQGSQPLPKPKRGSSAQFGSVFSPGSANSVSKLTNMFKKDKKGSDAPTTGPYSPREDSSLPPTPSAGGMGGGSASLPPTPRGRRGAQPKGQGSFSEVDLWRPQSTEERQQCMDAYDHKGFGRLGGLGEVDARALWTRQNMPPETFHQVWSLSDVDSNQLLSKPEFCLFMYLMHAIRNFGTSFRLPDQITLGQAARILGLEQLVRPSAATGPAAGGRDQAVPSSQGYSPDRANGGNGSLQGPQQYPQGGHQQTGSLDWEATGGLSPSQQQAVQELTEMGFDSRQVQEALEAHTWNRNAAANWLLQGGSNQPQPSALRRSTTDRSSNAGSLMGSGGGSGFGSQSMRSSGGSRVGRFSHGHTSSAGSTADWGSGNYSPSSAGGMSQPGSARTTGDSVPGSGVQFGSGTPRSSSRVPATGSARLGLTIRKVKMDYKGIMEKPFFTLSVRARGGTMLEQSQDTPPGVFSRGVMISDQALVLSTPISELPQGAVLFFELKHWKPKEKKFSLRGWALVAVSSLVDYSGSVPQLQTGTMKLSMLQKPVDLALSRKHKRLSPEGFDLEVNVNIA